MPTPSSFYPSVSIINGHRLPLCPFYSKHIPPTPHLSLPHSLSIINGDDLCRGYKSRLKNYFSSAISPSLDPNPAFTALFFLGFFSICIYRFAAVEAAFLTLPQGQKRLISQISRRFSNLRLCRNWTTAAKQKCWGERAFLQK